MTRLRVNADITLRSPALEDAALLFELIGANREHLGRWIPPLGAIGSVEEERRWITDRLEESDKQQPFLILYRGAVVGGVGLSPPTPDDAADVGYWLVEDHQGRGIVTRSVTAVLDHAFGERGLNRVRIRAAVENRRSRAIPEHLGFRLEGIERQGAKVADGYADMAVYSMLAAEWRARQRA